MPGETTGGPTERPPRPRRERPVTRETVRPIDTREDVEAAFYDSFGLLEHTDNSKLSPELQWAKKAIRSSIDKSLDRDSDTVTVDYNGEYTKFRQEEGIPVDHLIDFLNDKLSDSRYDTAERKNLQEKINILKRNSTPFYDVDLARSNPEQMVARIRYEAHLISQDSRATGSELGDWELAKKELNKRRELFVTPPSEPTAETEAGTVPADVTPPTATEPEPEFIGPPPPPAWAREILTVIGRRDEEIRNNALLERYQKIREEMKRGSLWDPRTWTRKIGLRLGEDYFGAKYLTKAIRAKLESGSTKAQAAFEGSAVDADYKRAEEQEAGKLGIKRARETKLFEGEKVTDATGELKKKIVDGLLKPIVDGTITDEKQLQAKIKEFVQSNQDNAELKAIFGPEASKYGNWADYFASDLLEMGASVRETMATHSKTLEELDSYIKIKLANLSWTAETGAPKVGAIDKLVMKMQGGSKRGLIWNPATLGATASLGTAVGLRALGTTAQASQFIVPGVGAVVGGGVAGLRRYHDMNVDRTAAQIEDTYSQSSEGNAPRRESLSQRDYDRAHVGELINGSGTDLVTGEERESISSLLSKDLSEGQETNRQAVLRRVAEIEKRLGFSRKEGLDLIRYDSQDTVQHGRLALLEAAISARNKLKEAGMSDEQIRETETRLKGEWEEKFIQNRDEQDRAFASYRLRNAAGSALFGGLAGLGAGALVQEGVAVTGRALGVNVGETGLEWAGKRIAEVGRAGRAAASELPKTNTAAASTLIQEIQGGSKQSSTVNEVVQTVVANKEVPVTQEWAKNATEIHERIWDKGNDQLLHTIKKGDALGLDITRMGENVQKLVRGGEIGFAFTTNNGQTVFISENSDMVKDGVLWLDPNSKNAKIAEFAKIILNQNELAKYQDGDIATELYNRKGVFNVKYVEAAQLVSDGNKNILHAYATIQGTGNMPSTVEVPTETPKPITETPKPIQTPPGQGTETPRPIQTPSPSETPRPITTPTPSATPTPTPTPGGGFDFGIPRNGPEIQPPVIPVPFSPRHPLEPIAGEKPTEAKKEESKGPTDPRLEAIGVAPATEIKGGPTLESMFASLPSPVIESDNKYFVERPPEDIKLTPSEMKALESKLPFFEQEGELIKARAEVVPFVWDPVVGIEKNPRFKQAEDLTQGDSGLLALAANSARTPAEQARLYRALTKSIVSIHENNPDLLKEWHGAQDEFSRSVFTGIDNQEIRKGNSSTILLGTELNATAEQQKSYIETVWPERIKQLKEAIANRSLEPHQLRWIEFMSHSVDVARLVEIAKTQQPTAETEAEIKRAEVAIKAPTAPTGSTARSAPTGGTEATIPTETPLPKAKDLKFGPEFDAAREREALAAGWKKSPSGTWTSPDGKRTQSFAPFPEPTREPEPVAPPAEPAVVEAPEVSVGMKLISTNTGQEYEVKSMGPEAKEGQEDIVLEDGKGETIWMTKTALEHELALPDSRLKVVSPEETPTEHPAEEPTAPPQKDEIPTATFMDSAPEPIVPAPEVTPITTEPPSETSVVEPYEPVEEEAEIPPGKPIFNNQGKIIGFEPVAEASTAEAVSPAIAEPTPIEPTKKEGSVEESKTTEEPLTFVAPSAGPTITPPIKKFEPEVELPPTHPAAEEPVESEVTEIPVEAPKGVAFEPTGNMAADMKTVNDLPSDVAIAEVKRRFGNDWEGTITDARLKLWEIAKESAYPSGSTTSKAPSAPETESLYVDQPVEEKAIELGEIPDYPEYINPDDNPVEALRRIVDMKPEQIREIYKKEFGKEWEGTTTDLKFELGQEAVRQAYVREGRGPKIESTLPTTAEPEEKMGESLEDLEARKDLTKLLHGQVDPNMPIEVVRQRLEQLRRAPEEKVEAVVEEEPREEKTESKKRIFKGIGLPSFKRKKEEKKPETEPVKTEVTTETAEDKARKYHLAIEERKQKLAEDKKKKEKKGKNGRPEILDNSRMRGKRFSELTTRIKKNISKRKK